MRQGTEKKQPRAAPQEKDREAPKPNIASPSFRIPWAASKEDQTKSGLSKKKNVFSHMTRHSKKWHS